MTSLKTHLLNMLSAGLAHEIAKAEKIGVTQGFSNNPDYAHQVQRALALKLARDRIAKQPITH